MMFTYHLDKANQIVYLGGEEPSLEEWQQTLLAVIADPEFERGYNFLSDRRIPKEPRSSDFLRAALAFLRVHADKLGACKWATVVSTTAAYGMGRMGQFLSEGMAIEIRVFTDLEEARHWLLTDESPLDQ